MLKVPVSGERLDILEWLRDPAAHFPSQRHGDLVKDGVSSATLAAKLGVSRAVARTHLDILTRVGLLRAKKIRYRTFYRRDEYRIAEVSRYFEKGW
ncbi:MULTISPECIES: helix-turn-helix domain-containing protein [Streptomyces]|uniref:ArsR family transcriptional regulator n=1 Tax=Streptomyces dengpaensis TaxID=2049881 RepID=A0ABM6T094_9ACTN|nr:MULTISPECIES: helix-turn-helix domain-containing protein [Streptomyces]AVH60396.1 ArsR family transcriptional regulator [Streptomyces dengpaensis]PIB07685.1 ArsR family transcriptional regulator [Streptomyces sp. HG99]